MRHLLLALALGLVLAGVCRAAKPQGDKLFRKKALAVAWPASWAVGRVGRPEVPYSLGVNINFTRPRPGEMRMLAAAGFRWVRMDFDWSKTERVKGHYEFHAYDRLLAALERHHMRALWILDYGNALYIPGNIGYPLTPPTTRKQRRAFCRWVAAAVRHFRGHGIIWEMWNEPNSTAFWPQHNGPEAHFGGANDGIIHLPVATIMLGINNVQGHHVAGQIAFSDLVVAAGHRRNLFTPRQHWTFSNGPEFPGAKGAFRLNLDPNALARNGGTARMRRISPRGVLSYDFTHGGAYCVAETNVAIPQLGVLRFRAKAAKPVQVLVRISDHTGQVFQFCPSYWKAGRWQHFHVRLGHWSAGGADYARLAVDVGKTIRRVAPHELFVGPALDDSGVYDPRLRFLRTCFAHGVLTYFDAVTIHPYRHGKPEAIIKVCRRIRALIARYAPKRDKIPIICSEWGYSRSWNGGGNARAARMLSREFLVSLYEGVPLTIYFNWGPRGVYDFGIVRPAYHAGRNPVYDAKPQYMAAQTLMDHLRDCHFVKRQKVGGPNVYVLLFVGPGGERIAAWKTGAKPQTVRIPLKPGTYRLTNETGTKTRNLLVPPREGRCKLTITHDPEYLAREGGKVKR